MSLLISPWSCTLVAFSDAVNFSALCSVCFNDGSANNWFSELRIESSFGISENLKGIDYAATFQKVDSTLQNVHLLTEKLGSKDNSIGLLLNYDALYKNLNATSANAASLLKDLQEHPKRYVHFSLFGKKDK